MLDAWYAIFLLGLMAGAMNALAGGGPILVVAALAALGQPADIASLTSTVALLPGQIASGWYARHSLVPIGPSPVRRTVAAVALLGGAVGAGLLLVTPTAMFGLALPALILFATGLYAWNSRAGGASAASGAMALGAGAIAVRLAPLAVYGGFYGGGNSFLVLALLTRLRVPPRAAAHAKNLLVLLINAAATLIFVASGAVAVGIAVPLGAGALAGGLAGTRLIDRIAPARLRFVVIACGTLLALWIAAREWF
ncbi:sulfite exporter TauE/SafE family protein [Sphingomonas adhaesiva]|uniref:sulfite exporter TauE/SafE family protein n=1 Tax=Sphingomonas adhaesiva TaxID=28212 RepID=UPI002FF68008